MKKAKILTSVTSLSLIFAWNASLLGRDESAQQTSHAASQQLPSASRRGYLGIGLVDQEIDPYTGERGYPVVTTVEPWSPASRAGFRQGDVVLAVGARKVHNAREVVSAIDAIFPGQETTITILRSEQKLTLSVTVAKRLTDVAKDLGLHAEPASPPVAYVSPTSVAWHAIMARDATFKLQLPEGWQETGTQILEDFSAVSQRGEALASGMVEVYENHQVLQMSLPGYKMVLPPTKIALMERLVAPPLEPVQVVLFLFPKLAHGAIGNMSVLETQVLPSTPGSLTTLVHYRYLLYPHRDAAFAAGLPPVLFSQNEVPMEAVGIISTNQGNGLTWGLTYGIIAAPQSVFANNQAIYAAIYQSYEFIPQGLALKIKNNQAAANLAAELNHTTREVAHLWWLRLGGLAESGGTPGDPAPRTIFPDPGPCPGGTHYRCNNVVYCLYQPPPASSGCLPVPPPR